MSYQSMYHPCSYNDWLHVCHRKSVLGLNIKGVMHYDIMVYHLYQITKNWKAGEWRFSSYQERLRWLPLPHHTQPVPHLHPPATCLYAGAHLGEGSFFTTNHLTEESISPNQEAYFQNPNPPYETSRHNQKGNMFMDPFPPVKPLGTPLIGTNDLNLSSSSMFHFWQG